MIFEQRALKKVLSHAKSIKNANMLFVAEEGIIEISGDSLYLAFSETGMLSEEAENMPISENMAKLIEAMEPGEIKIGIDEKGITVRQGKTKAKFLVALNERYVLSPIQNAEAFSISGKVLKKMINRVRYAVAILDSRIALTGVRLFAKENILTAEGVDGYQAAQVKAKKTKGGDNFEMIIPMSACVKLLELLDDNKDVQIKTDGKRAEFIGDGWSLRCSLIAAAAMPVDKIISDAENAGAMLKFSTPEILAALSKAKIIMGGSIRLIKLHVNRNFLRITANGNEGDFEDELQQKGGDAPADLDMMIGINANYLNNMAQACEADTLSVRVKNETSPLIAYAEDEEMGLSFRALALPVRIQRV